MGILKNRFLAGLLLLAGAPLSAYAQANAEIVIRQGDSIAWAGASGTHKLNFGANGTTSVKDIDLILEFKPALVPNTTNPSEHESANLTGGALQSATVRKDKATIGKTFVFTCGIHKTAMISVEFRVAPEDPGQKPRTYQIMGEAPGAGVFQWHLHVDTTPKS